MGAKSSKTHVTASKSDIGKFITPEETIKLQQFFRSIQDAKVENLMRHWRGQIDPLLQQQVTNYISSSSNVALVDFQQFATLFVLLVRGTSYDKTDVFVDLLTNSQRTEQIHRRNIAKHVESVISTFILTHKSTNWNKGAKLDTESLAAALCSELPPEVTHEQITTWLANEPKISLLHTAVFGNLYQIHSTKQHLIPTNEMKASAFLTISSVFFINTSLPADFRKEWRLLFSSAYHGESFSKLLGFITKQGPTVIVVKDRGGSVFGGFAPHPWVLSPNFAGNDTSFLFRIKPTVNIYYATHINNHYQYLNVQQQTMPNGLGMGGQFSYWGLWLDQEFGKGQSSETCTTYRNYKMLSSGKEFSFDSLEVWAVGPRQVEDEQPAQRSVLDTKTEARAMLEMMGKKSHSDGLREPEKD